MESLGNLLNILKVALGLGFVIFLHELGHFLLAKWNGVKVEKFSIGFGPTLLGFTKGETEYVLAAIPLGGFVKMLGEGPEEEANKSTDPRAYPNKSVGARMAIISAGVIMNLILGLACFVYVYGQGMDEIPPTIGAVMADAPAYEAGLRAGDQIVAIDGRSELTFNNVTLMVRLSGQGQVLHFDLKRPGQTELVSVDIEPRRGANAEVPGVGIFPSESLRIGPEPVLWPAGAEGAKATEGSGLKPRDRIKAVGPVGEPATDVKDMLDWRRLISRYRDKPLAIVVDRPVAAESDASGSRTESVTVNLPVNRFVDFGFRLESEAIAAIRKGSPAEAAGFRKGDTILKVDGRDDFDPMTLPTLCYEKAGQPMVFEVSRPESAGPPRTVTIQVTPDDTPPWTEIAFANEPVDLAGIGIAVPVTTKIQAVRPDSPAARAGLKAGDHITKMVLPNPPARPASKGLWSTLTSWMGSSEPKPDEVDFGTEPRGWSRAFQQLQFRPLGEVKLWVNNSNVPVAVTPEPVSGWFHPNRGVQLELLIEKTPPLPATAALQRGFQDTIDNILSIYAMFRSLAQNRVSPKNLGGPIMIAQVAYTAAGASLTDLVHFLGILSINLAVLNFLPIPPLDGGQMVFLLAEKVRGRPLPESALIAGTYLGLLLVLGLMAFVLFQDISRLVKSAF
ncbi:MAG: site-2 protease family protein [Isosphaeraceae bacterium]